MFKKYKQLFVGLIAGAILATGTSVFAEDGLVTIQAYLRTSLPFTLNGQSVTLDNPALTYQGNTYVKLRDIVKLVPNVGINWNEQTQTVQMSTYGTVTGGTYGGGGSTPPVATVPTTPPPTTTPTAQTTPSQSQQGIQFEVLKDYIPNAASPALRYKNTIYISARDAGDKFNVHPITWEPTTKQIKFEKINLVVQVSDTFSENVNAFIYNGTTYVNERLLITQ